MCLFSKNRSISIQGRCGPPFVASNSVVRTIWGSSDMVLFIFAAASAEFAVNKSVDWLFYTGKLPADPLGRMFSTVTYARSIIFSDNDGALAAIDSIAAIHRGVEERRGQTIPQWAYRDVLYMLIAHSITAHTLLKGPLTEASCAEVFAVFRRVGEHMGIEGIPDNYTAWGADREEHINRDLSAGVYTTTLFASYRRHLGPVRFMLLRQVQAIMLPPAIALMTETKAVPGFGTVIKCYCMIRSTSIAHWLKNMLLPGAYRMQIRAIDVA